MQAVLEKPPVVDETELAAATIEAVTDLLKASAPPPPPLAAPVPTLKAATKCEPGTFKYAAWSVKSGKPGWQHKVWETMNKGTLLAPIHIPTPQGDTPGGSIVAAAAGWCPTQGLIGVPGTGEADVDMKFPAAGPIALAEVADFLDWAAERIIRVGWVQGTERYDDFVCSVGALRLRQRALIPRMGGGRATALSEQACGALVSYLHRHKGNMQGIIGWNDASGRTKGEVVTAFREAAAELRGISAPRIRRAVLA